MESIPASTPPTKHRTNGAAGFTLIELMITIAIVAILAVAAVASYNFAMVKARRGAAQGCLGEMAQYMERFHTSNLRYDQDADGNAVVLPTCSTDVTAFYTVGFPAASPPTTTTFTIEAVPQGSQASDEKQCGTMTVNQVGTRTPTTGCW